MLLILEYASNLFPGNIAAGYCNKLAFCPLQCAVTWSCCGSKFSCCSMKFWWLLQDSGGGNMKLHVVQCMC